MSRSRSDERLREEPRAKSHVEGVKSHVTRSR